MYERMCVYKYACMYVCMYLCINVSTYVCKYVWTDACMYVCKYIQAYVSMHVMEQKQVAIFDATQLFRVTQQPSYQESKKHWNLVDQYCNNDYSVNLCICLVYYYKKLILKGNFEQNRYIV